MRNKEFVKMILLMLLPTAVGTILCCFINKYCALVVLAVGIACTVCAWAYTKQRYNSISQLNDYLSSVCTGNYNLDISDNTEGELSILKNNLYKVVVLLQSSNEALKNDKIYLADYLANISHQLKNPLTSIMVISDLLKSPQSDEKHNELVGIIDEQTEKMSWLVATLLKLSKLDTGTVKFNNENISVVDLINDSLKSFDIILDIKQIQVKKDFKDFQLFADKNWLIQAIENVLKNCIEHTAQQGEITITTASTNLFDEIVIQDNGCGISRDELPHIFDRFYHGKNTTKDSVGIGLALTKAILTQQKGEITATSCQGVGTRFSIKFYKAII